MEEDKEESVPTGLSNAATDSVTQAISRGRKRRAGRPSVATGEIRIGSSVARNAKGLVSPSKQLQSVSYHKRRRTNLLPGTEEEEEDDSNDEWEEQVELDEETVEAVVAQEQQKRDERNKAFNADTKVSIADDNTNGKDRGVEKEEEERLTEADRKAKQRLLAAAKRKKCLRTHSLHIVLSVANLMRLDDAANNEDLRGLALSVVPEDSFLAFEGFNERIARLGLWLRATFTTSVIPLILDESKKPTELVRRCSPFERADLVLASHVGDIMDVLVIVAAAIRAQGLRCRIVSPLQLVSHQAPKATKKENKVTGRKQVIEVNTDKKNDAVLYGWAEIWSPSDRKWVPLDVSGGHMSKGNAPHVLRESMESIPSFDSVSLGSEKQRRKTYKQPFRRRQRGKGANQRPRSVRTLGDDLFAHVVAIENGVVTDVTRRYSRDWMKVQKSRAKGNVFLKVVENLSRSGHDRSQDETYDAEMAEFDELAANEAIPTTVTAIHNHPRFVLERHVKKYEAIFPRDPIVGFIKDEPIFLRSNVHLLHTQSRWIRQMREVKEGEAPLKSVRSKNGTDAQVDLFGEWQTSSLVIPECINGKVPRGIHGNVDLWTPSHLPKGTAHINLQHAKIAARKLGIDFAPAMTGFDVRCGRSIPRIEGVVVATDNADLVRDAARAAAKMAAERIERRAREDALGRWVKLLRSIKARQTVRKRYGGLGDDGLTYEAMRKKEGVRKARQEKGESSIADALRESEPQIRRTGRRNANPSDTTHEHEFGEAVSTGRDTFTKVCKICSIEVSFEQL